MYRSWLAGAVPAVSILSRRRQDGHQEGGTARSKAPRAKKAVLGLRNRRPRDGCRRRLRTRLYEAHGMGMRDTHKVH